jgi:hypothetical protein
MRESRAFHKLAGEPRVYWIYVFFGWIKSPKSPIRQNVHENQLFYLFYLNIAKPRAFRALGLFLASPENLQLLTFFWNWRINARRKQIPIAALLRKLKTIMVDELYLECVALDPWGEKFYDVHHDVAAKQLGISKGILKWHAKCGLIKGKCIGKNYYYNSGDLIGLKEKITEQEAA